MNTNLKLILCISTSSWLCLSAHAQNDPLTTSSRAGDEGNRVTTPTGDRLNGAAKASDIIGMKVNNYQNEKLGSVEELAVDVESGRIIQVILTTGGFIGVGNRLTAVPPGALHYDAANKVLHLDANKEKIKGAPEFMHNKWMESSDSEHLSAVYGYFGQEPAFRFVHQADPSDRNADTTTTRNPDGTLSKDAPNGARQWMIPASRLSHVQKASKLMGMTVKNKQDEKLGKVDNLLLDVQSGRIVALVVSSGGFLGMGDELSAVPPTALSFNTERDALQLDTTKEQLSNAPHFKSNQWPDFNEATYSDSVYRAYKVDPYFTTNQWTDVDNASRNTRDRGDRTLTPLDQGNSQSDTDTTAEIRKAILQEKDMSVNAKNVKIITNKGRVTLRGPVKSSEEKRLIGEIANRVARSENVDNQLEVSVKTSSN